MAKRNRNKKVSKKDKVLAGLQTLHKVSTGSKKKEAGEHLKDYQAYKKYRGKKRDIYKALQKIYDETPSIRPSVGVRKTTEYVYKQIKKGKVTKGSVYSLIVKKYKLRDFEKLRRLINVNASIINWFGFIAQLKYLNGGISLKEYQILKHHGVSLKYKKKVGKLVKSDKITLFKEDKVIVTCNNSDLEVQYEIGDEGTQAEYYRKLREAFDGQESPLPYFIFQRLTDDGKTATLHYHLIETEGAEAPEIEPQEPEPPTKPLTETEQKIKLLETEERVLKAKTEENLSAAKRAESITTTIKIMQSMGATNAQIFKALGLD